MTRDFNDFFVNIGNGVEDKIPRVTKHFESYLGNCNLHNLWLTPVDENELFSMISKLNISKACGPNSIPSKILKSNALLLSRPLLQLLNLSFAQGNFPDLLKKADACPIFKRKTKTSVKSTDRYHYSFT